jgi:hypothetical protein
MSHGILCNVSPRLGDCATRNRDIEITAAQWGCPAYGCSYVCQDCGKKQPAYNLISEISIYINQSEDIEDICGKICYNSIKAQLSACINCVNVQLSEMAMQYDTNQMIVMDDKKTNILLLVFIQMY